MIRNIGNMTLTTMRVMSHSVWTMTNKEHSLWTTDDVATLLNVHESTVRRLCQRGTLPHYSVGRNYRFDPEKIRAWMAENEHVPGEEELPPDDTSGA